MPSPRKGKRYPDVALKNAVVDFVRAYRLRNHGIAPSLREIVNGTPISAVSMASYYVKELVLDGKFGRIGRTVSRGIYLIDGSDLPKRKGAK